jgi:hypothetical protein
MKLLNNKILLIILVLFSGLGYVISCTRDNSSIVPIEITQPFVPTRGNHVHLPGMTAGDTTQWKLDKEKLVLGYKMAFDELERVE